MNDQIFNGVLTGYNGLLLIVCCYFSIRSRRCWAVYKEYESLSTAIYLTALFCVVAGVLDITQFEDISFTVFIRNLIVSLGSMIVIWVMFSRRLLEAKKNRIVEQRGETTDRRELVLQDQMEEVQIRTRFAFLSFLGFKAWDDALLIITRKRIIAIYTGGVSVNVLLSICAWLNCVWYIPLQNMVAHYLEQMSYQNKSEEVPNSFLLFDNRVVYWFRTKDSESFERWDEWLNKICSSGFQEKSYPFTES
jgi:hypothetical protein